MLSQKGVEVEERDFFKEPLSEAELRGLLAGRAAAELFSWKSPSAKALGLEGRQPSDDELVRLMLQEPRLLRRPVLKVGERLIIGDLKAMEAALG